MEFEYTSSMLAINNDEDIASINKELGCLYQGALYFSIKSSLNSLRNESDIAKAEAYIDKFEI